MAEQTLSPISINKTLTSDVGRETISAQLPADSAISAIESDISHLNDYRIAVSASQHVLISEDLDLEKIAYVPIVDGSFILQSAGPVFTTGGGLHDNTQWISYSGQDYLKCRHLYGTLTGNYTSPEFDIGGGEAANRHLIYVIGEDAGETDIVITGEGTTWDDKLPSPTKWSEALASSRSWSEIFDLPGAPSVNMRLYYGSSSPPTSYIDRMEILSAIIPAGNQYFKVRVTITDPNINVYAYVEAFTLKFCTYS